jgi:hypothetical protein
VAVRIEGVGAVDTAHEPLARSTVADAEEHAVFDPIPERATSILSLAEASL